jgi:hypothetical protein
VRSRRARGGGGKNGERPTPKRCLNFATTFRLSHFMFATGVISAPAAVAAAAAIHIAIHL